LLFHRESNGLDKAVVRVGRRKLLDEELFFECSVTTSVTTTTHNSWFCGFVDATAVTAISPITAAGALADVNMVGFHSPEGASLTIDTVYKADGITAVQVKDTVSAQAAGVYVKVGMHLKKGVLTFFVNGLPQPDTKSVPDDTGTDFPADVQLRPCLAMLHGAGATGVVSTKFLWARQLRA